MWSWRMDIGGQTVRGEHDYAAEDILGQAALTEAMFDWLDDDRKVHPLNLARSMDDFALLLAIYTSGLTRAPVTLPHTSPPELIARMRAGLAGE